MRERFLKLGRGAAAAAAAVATTGFALQAFAADKLGQPTDGALGFQPAATELRQRAIDFHTFLLFILTGICALVLGLLLWCVVRYNKRANPTPARFTHNTLVEVIWTTGPVLILLVIAIFSFRLLFDYHDMPAPYMTVKVTGYQWYWGYEYPDQKIPEQISNMVKDQKVADADGVQLNLDATNPMVVPVGKVVRVLVTGADVIHSFSVNAFGIKIDAVPGRVNQTWFKADKIGTFTGQCSQLCGLDHAFMPIVVKVVSQADFDAWAAGKAPKPAATTPALAQPAAAAAASAAKP